MPTENVSTATGATFWREPLAEGFGDVGDCGFSAVGARELLFRLRG